MSEHTRSVGSRASALALAVAMALALMSAIPATVASAALPDAEARMLGHLNSARAGNGLGELVGHDTLTQVARQWAAQLASDHDSGATRQEALRHNPSMASQIPSGYRRAGENVGYSVLTGASNATLVDRLHDAYMGSAGHRANILGDFDRVGVGLVTADDGTMWSAVVFMLGPEPAKSQETATKAGSEPAKSTGPGTASGSGSGAASGSESGQGSTARSQPEPRRAPPPEPPTTAELFGPEWPEGYLSGDREAAKGLLVRLRDVRALVSLLPGSPPTDGHRLLGAPVTGI